MREGDSGDSAGVLGQSALMHAITTHFDAQLAHLLRCVDFESDTFKKVTPLKLLFDNDGNYKVTLTDCRR